MRLNKLTFVLPIVFSLTLASCGGGGGSGSSSGVLPGTPLSPKSTSVQTSTYSSAVMADAPTAYYHLDDTSSTAADASGNGLNGTIGSSVQKGVTGLVPSTSDTAVGTPGLKSSAGVVHVAPNAKLQPSNAVSLEAFLRFSSTPADFTVPVDYGQRSGIAPYGWYFKGGHLIAQFTLSTGLISLVTPSALSPNTTYHVVSTFDGSTGRLYLNGKLVASASRTGTLTDYTSGYGLNVGDSGAYGDPAFNGTIDEVAVYAGKALTATQVSDQYNAANATTTSTPAPTVNPTTAPTAAPVTSTATTGYANAVMADAPTAYYHLDDTSSTAADASGNGLNGAIGSSVQKGVTGLVPSTSDTAVGTPGLKSSAGVVHVAPNAKLQPSNAVSLEAFLRFSSTPADFTVPVDYGQRSGIAPYGWYFKGGHLIAQFTLSTGIISLGTSSALSPNTTYHVVSTFDGSTGRLYLNGKLVASASRTGTLTDYTSGYGLNVGDSGAYGDPAFNGTIDEVAVYAGKALTATQVSDQYNAANATSTSTPITAPTVDPTTAPTASPTAAPTATPAPPATTASVHYFDNTGCQDFPANDYWNRSVDKATVSSNSATEIQWAASQSGSSGAPNFNGHYDYEVVPTNLTERTISKTSSHPVPANYESPAQSGWPIPSDMGNLLPTGDHVSVLLQQSSPPSDCRGWDGYAFSGSGTSWSAYSGDHVEMNQDMPPETCNGVASLCGEDLEGDLTYYELNANTGNASGVVTHPILHAIHTEWPCSVAGTCGNAPADAFNKSFNCRTSCARLRLKASAVPRPSDPNAAALYDAMVHYGLDTSENGCCWGFYTLWRADDPGYPSTIPSAVSAFIKTLRVTDFQVLNNGSW